jgi:hypothetical protein
MSTTPKTYEFATADVPNKNGRLYPLAVLNDIVTACASRTLFGMIGPFTINTANVDLDRVSHVVENLRVDGDVLKGEVRILDTPMGKIMKSLEEAGIPLHFRTAGYGHLKHRDDDIQEYYHYSLRSIDLVSNPA